LENRGKGQNSGKIVEILEKWLLELEIGMAYSDTALPVDQLMFPRKKH